MALKFYTGQQDYIPKLNDMDAAFAAAMSYITGSDTVPTALGTAVAGSVNLYARGDHVHPSTGVTQAAGNSTTQYATTAFVTTAGNLKANLVSPALTGTPTSPTATAGNSSTRVATTAFVSSADALKANIASPTFTGVVTATSDVVIGGNLTINGTTTTVNSTTVSVDDPTLTLGGDTAPTFNDTKDRGIEYRWHNGTSPKTGFFGFKDSTGKMTFIPDATNTSEVFTGATGTIVANLEGTASNVTDIVAIVNGGTGAATATSGLFNLGGAPLLSPELIGAPTAPTAALGNNTTQIATTSFVTSAGNLKANLASPALSGTPTAPTATFGNNTTQLSTTAFTLANALALRSPLGANVDLDSLIVTGIYHQSTNANTSLTLNYPIALAGKLVIYSAGLMTYQEYQTYQSEGIFFRSKYSTNAWSAWQKIATTVFVSASTSTLKSEFAATSGATLVGANAYQTQDAVNLERLTFERFGAVGNGLADDSAPIMAALTAAQGKQITVKSGKTYLLGTAINYAGDVSLKSSGATPAVIYHSGQSFTPLTITGTLQFTRNLAITQQIHNHGWDLDSATGVLPGMLVEVKSSASWYHDPRPEATDARKSELHRVAYVVGNTVYMEDLSNDGYPIPTETVTLAFYTPVTVNLENITIRLVLPATGVDVAAVGGVKLSYAYEPYLLNVNTENAAACGVSLNGCYGGHVEGGHSHASNAYSTGYGVQLSGSANCRVSGRKFWRCRRGVDVSGANIITRHTLIDSNINHGGGVNSEGTSYGWTDEGATGAAQFGFGSHGPADHTIYRGNTVSRMHSFIIVRGRNELIEDNNFIGRSRSGGIAALYGENLTVRNNRAYMGAGAFKNTAITEGGGNINSRRCDYFVYFLGTYQGGEIIIEGNHVEVQEACVYFAETVFPTVTIARNRVRLATSSATTDCYLAYNAGVSQSPANWVIVDNEYRRVGGTGLMALLFGITEGANWRLIEVFTVTPPVVDGEWTPTVVAGSNCSAVTGNRGLWSRVGNRVSFNCSIVVTPTAAGTAIFTMSLPVSRSNFSSTTSGGGTIGISSLSISGGGACYAKTTTQIFDCRVYINSTSATGTQVSGAYEL